MFLVSSDKLCKQTNKQTNKRQAWIPAQCNTVGGRGVVSSPTDSRLFHLCKVPFCKHAKDAKGVEKASTSFAWSSRCSSSFFVSLSLSPPMVPCARWHPQVSLFLFMARVLGRILVFKEWGLGEKETERVYIRELLHFQRASFVNN